MSNLATIRHCQPVVRHRRRRHSKRFWARGLMDKDTKVGLLVFMLLVIAAQSAAAILSRAP